MTSNVGARAALIRAVLAATIMATGGCARASAHEGFTDVERLVRDRTGAVAAWRTDSLADAAAADTVRELLGAPLDEARVVRVTLLASRDLQAVYEDVGVGRADVVQAALLSNPILSLGRINRDGVNEFSLVQSFVDLLQRPLRRRVAAAQFRSTQFRVADEVFQHVAAARTAYIASVAADQSVELRRAVLAAADASAGAARAIHVAGNLQDIDLAGQLALASEARAELTTAEAESVRAREALARSMGVAARGRELQVAARLLTAPGAEPSEDSLVALAVGSRLDLEAAFADVSTAGARLGLTRGFRLLRDGSLGWGGEREGGGEGQQGVAVSLPIPLFDQGQAATAADRARLRQAISRHGALVIAVRSQVRAALAQVAASRARADLFRTRIVPLRNRVLRETLLQQNAMSVSVFTLLVARQGQVEAGTGLVGAMRDYWTARIELERVVGTLLPLTDTTDTTIPTDALADSTSAQIPLTPSAPPGAQALPSANPHVHPPTAPTPAATPATGTRPTTSARPMPAMPGMMGMSPRMPATKAPVRAKAPVVPSPARAKPIAPGSTHRHRPATPDGDALLRPMQS